MTGDDDALPQNDPSRDALPAERVGLGLAAAGVAAAAAIVLTVGLSEWAATAVLGGVAVSAGAGRAYVAASGGRLRRGVGPLTLLVVSAATTALLALVFVDVWHVYDWFGLGSLGVARTEFVAHALTSGAVLREYAGTAGLLTSGALIGALPVVRHVVRAERAAAIAARPDSRLRHRPERAVVA